MNTFLDKALIWAQGFDSCAFFFSNGHTQDEYATWEILLAVGNLNTKSCNGIETLDSFIDDNNEWKFGLLTYNLKDKIENLSSKAKDVLGFPEMFFFIPQYVVAIKEGEPEVLKGDKKILLEIDATNAEVNKALDKVEIKAKISKETYLARVNKLKEHIRRGDIYEVNFCQEFFAENVHIDPVAAFINLTKESPMPFSGMFKKGDKYIICASPERFLARRGTKLISEPIKGTASRFKDDLSKDEEQKRLLHKSVKEQAENVMIVDLVRNDLTKCAKAGTVRVEHQARILAFEQVYQMVSTISCEQKKDVKFSDILKATFPMGSMTGAPKIKAMQLIDDYEESFRGVFSGSLGYIAPSGDFDFNVVIRSILYDQKQQHLSFHVGSAITHLADAEQEYQECLLKSKAIMNILGYR